ncbi:MAG: hypothetical protein IJX20_02170 [Alphaproteobacteria bacterium]|nr:hypothetical protein [Alphaproteobacteria bacterium]
MLKTILLCGISFISSAYALEQKVYSAEELQKMADSVFQEVNSDNKKTDKVNILASPIEIKKEAILKEIEKAVNIKNDNSINDIYKLVQQASQPEKTIPVVFSPAVIEEQPQVQLQSINLTEANASSTLKATASDSSFSMPEKEAQSTNKETLPAAAATTNSDVALHSFDSSRSSSSNLDDWLAKSKTEDKTHKVTTSQN